MTKTTQARLKREEQIKQLQNECKLLIQKERKEKNQARTKRLCTRGGAIEKLLPELATFTDEQFDIFVKKVILSAQTKRIIAEIAAVNPEPPAEPQGGISFPESQVVTIFEPAEAETDVEQA